jgi:hypothetical protein
MENVAEKLDGLAQHLTQNLEFHDASGNTEFHRHHLNSVLTFQ